MQDHSQISPAQTRTPHRAVAAGVVGVAGGVLLSIMSVVAQLCVGQQYFLSDWFLFNDGFILAGLGSYPPDRVATLGALLMLATLVIDVALIVLPVVCLWYYRSIRPVGAVPSLLLVFSGLGALLSWLLIVPQWAMWAWDDESFLETLANAGQDTKLICVLFGIPALIGGILILGRRKRWAELVPA